MEMETHRRKPTQNHSRHREEDFRALSHRILEYANRGVLRDTFQRDVSKMIMDFSGSDSVELWLKEHGKYFGCEARKHGDPSSSFDIRPCMRNEDGEIIPGPEDDPNLIHLCRDMIFGRSTSFHPFLTPHGSFWTGNLKQRSTRRLGTDVPFQRRGNTIAGSYPSLVLIPLSIDQQNIGLLQLKSKARDFFPEEEIVCYEGLARSLGEEKKSLEIELAHLYDEWDEAITDLQREEARPS